MKEKLADKSQLNYRYIRLAEKIENKISGGDYCVGEKLPSIRRLHAQLNLSISTVYQAYIELEKRGVVESRIKSGFYVKPPITTLLPPPRLKRHKAIPQKVTVNALAGSIVESMNDSSILQLGGASPAPELLPCKQLSRILKSLSHQELSTLIVKYGYSGGVPDLKYEIAKRSLCISGNIREDDIITTNGCMEAVGFCLRAVAEPGDTILVESPTFHGFLQLIEDLNMFALEVATNPETGIDLEALDSSLKQHRVKACLLIPNFQNPLGSLMPDQKKKALVKLLTGKNIPVIEDDVYGDLYFGKKRPLPLKAFDEKDMVLYCSSFSKSLAPGMRVGWTIPGKFDKVVRRLKLNSCLTSAALNQKVIAEYLKNGSYDRHLRKYRNALRHQMSNIALAIARHFPKDTHITVPKGGLVLWVQLNRHVDSFKVYKEAIKKKIMILPGIICTSSKKYNNCIRISCALSWNKRLEMGIIQLARIISRFTG